MVEMSPELVVIAMFGGAIIGILLGYPIGIVVGGVAMFIGFANIGVPVFYMFRAQVMGLISSYILLALPLFVFMGEMVARSGAAERLYRGIYVWSGGFRGGLAIGTVLMGAIIAACVGVVAASLILIGLIAIPHMLERGYNKELVCGSVCAGGTLGILIPPSIMLIVYGPMAGISVGKLFMGAFVPGFLLAGLYVGYIAIHSWLRPKLAPAIPLEERAVPLLKKMGILVTAILPVVFLILAVLGTIFLGIATPTEAAAVGAVAAVLLAVAYRNFNWQILKETTLHTMRTTGMAYIVGTGAIMFTSVFLKLGGGEVITDLLLASPGGRWGTFAVIMFIIFILGFFIDWIGIVFIMVPLITPTGAALGFDPIWFAMMVVVNLQMAFMTPPMAAAIFYLKGMAKPEWEITTAHIIRGVIPFVLLIMVALGLLVAFPQLILWLPGVMIK